MSEIRNRLTAAWAALRGHAIISGITIDNGDVEFLRLPALVNHRAMIRNSCVIVPGPFIARVGKDAIWERNTGDAVQEVIHTG